MDPSIFGMTQTIDPRMVDTKNIKAPAGSKAQFAGMGYDHADKMQRKSRKGFPYARLATDSDYFFAYKKLHDCVRENTEGDSSLSASQMEAACGREWKAMKILAINGGLRYEQVNAPFFEAAVDAKKGFNPL